MTTVTEIEDKVTALTTTLGSVKTKIDEVAAFILTLKGPATQADLDQISTMLDSASTLASGDLDAVDKLDE